MIDKTQIAAALSGASSVELYQLVCLIDRMLEDPRRILEVRKHLHQGQVVRCVDPRSGELVSMRIAALHDVEASVIASSGHSHARRIPYVSIEPPQETDGLADERHQRDAPQPTARRPGREDFKRGDKVGFEDKYLRPMVGIVVRVNQRTASIDCENGESWRVGFHALRHIVDI